MELTMFDRLARIRVLYRLGKTTGTKAKTSCRVCGFDRVTNARGETVCAWCGAAGKQR